MRGLSITAICSGMTWSLGEGVKELLVVVLEREEVDGVLEGVVLNVADRAEDQMDYSLGPWNEFPQWPSFIKQRARRRWLVLRALPLTGHRNVFGDAKLMSSSLC